MRSAAMRILGELTDLSKHVPIIIGKHDDKEPLVRKAVVETLGKLNSADLSDYAPILIDMLDDTDVQVGREVVNTLRKLNSVDMSNHVPKLIDKLHDINRVNGDHSYVVEILRKMDRAILDPHMELLNRFDGSKLAVQKILLPPPRRWMRAIRSDAHSIEKCVMQ